MTTQTAATETNKQTTATEGGAEVKATEAKGAEAEAAKGAEGKGTEAKVDHLEKGAQSHREIAAKEIIEQLGNEEIFKDGMFLGKYKTLEEMAKGHKSLAEMATKKQPKAPDEYDTKQFKIEGVDGYEFDPEHPLSKAALPVLKELGMSQENANKLINAALKAQYVDPAAELKKLSDNQEEAVGLFKEVHGFLEQNVPEELRDAAAMFTETADGVKLIKHLMGLQLDRELPDDNGALEAGRSAEQLQQEAFDYYDKHVKTIGNSPNQQAEYQRLMDVAGKAKIAAKKNK